MSKPKGLEVDRRVGIALSVLPRSQRSAVERVIESPQAFIDVADRPGQVHVLHTSGQQLYMMRVTPTLRLVYTFVGETVHVLDLVERATLDRFSPGNAAKGSTKRKGTKGRPKSGSQKPADFAEK
jgi:hypothetical protein